MDKEPITVQGLEKIKMELKELKNIKRPKISINLLIIKLKAVLVIFFISILNESNLSLCII